MMMQHALQVQFDYDVFKAAYDSDPGIPKLVKNFDKNQITFSDGSAADDMPTAQVASMAKSATNSKSGL